MYYLNAQIFVFFNKHTISGHICYKLRLPLKVAYHIHLMLISYEEQMKELESFTILKDRKTLKHKSNLMLIITGYLFIFGLFRLFSLIFC